jgi:hypothetical protein
MKKVLPRVSFSTPILFTAVGLGIATVLPISAQPDNDLFVHRQIVSGDTVDFTAWILDATMEPGEPNHTGPFGITTQSVWYQWTATDDGWGRVRLMGWSGGEVVASVYTGESVDALTLIQATSQGSTGYFPVHAGWDYQIAVYPKREYDISGFIEAGLQVQFLVPPSNDSFAQRILLSDGDLSVPGSLVGATREVDEPSIGSDVPEQTVWWSWTAPVSGTAVVTFRDPDSFVFGHLAAAFKGDTLGDLILLASNSLISDLPLNFQAQEGETYQLMVGSWTPDLVDGFTMDLVMSSWHLTSPAEGARFEVPGQVTINWANPPPNTTLRNVQAISPQGYLGWWSELSPEGFTIGNLPKGEYSVQLMALDDRNRTYATPPRHFSVELANDNFANRIVLEGSSLEVTGHLAGATIEPNEPGDEPSVWWTWIPPYSGRAVLHINYGARFDLFTGNTLANLQPIPSVVETFDRFAFDVVGGLQIQIRAGSLGDWSNPSFQLELFEPLPNDRFAGRIPLTTAHVDQTFSIGLAGVDSAEPAILHGPDSATVWFTWTAPSEGWLGFGGGATDGYYGYAVFTGESLASLVPVADPSFGVVGTLFSPVAGTTYQIAAIGHQSNPGTMTFLMDFKPAPPNDQFAKAQVITGTQGQVDGNNEMATVEPGEPQHHWSQNEQSVWYSWTAPRSGFLRVFATTDPPPGYSYDPVVAIYRGANLTSLEKLSSEIANINQPVYADVEAGITYHFAVSGMAYSQTSDFQLHWSVVDRPANDSFAGRQLLEGIRVSVSAVNLGATREVGEPAHGGAERGRSVWWSWTAPYSGWVTLSAFSPIPISVQLLVYQGTSLENLTLAGDSTPLDELGWSFPEFTLAASVFEVTAGQTYQLVLDTPGDAFDMAVPLGGSFELELDLSTFRLTSPESEAIFGSSNQVKFMVNSPLAEVDGQIMEVDFRSLGMPESPLGISLGITSAPPFSITRNNLPPDRYLVMAWATNKTGDLRVTPPILFTVRPENDDFADRISLAERSYFLTGTLAGASHEANEPLLSENTNAPTVWYSWTAPVEGVASFDLIGLDGLFRVYVGDSIDQLAPVTEASSSVRFHATRGGRYEIVVEATDPLAQNPGSLNSFNLQIEVKSTQLIRPQWYDRVVVGAPLVIEAATTEQPGDLQALEFLINGELVGTVTAPPYRFNWSGNVVGQYQIGVRPRFTSGQTGMEDSVMIQVTPFNDSFAARQSVTGAQAFLLGSTEGATTETGEPDTLQESIWFTWRAPGTGLVTLDGSGSSYWPRIAMFSGSELESLIPVVDNFGQLYAEPFTIWVEGGLDYQFAVDSRGGLTGPVEFSLSLQLPPANDNFENSYLLSGASGEVQASLFLATAQSGEPDHEGLIPRHSVWWTWIAPVSGSLQISTPQSSESQISFGAYVGETLETLIAVPTVHMGSSIDLNVYSGVRYYFAFDEFYNGIEDLSWQYRMLQPPANDAFANRIMLAGRMINFTTSLLGATHEPMEPKHHDQVGAGSAWWSWTAEANGHVKIQLSPYSFSPLIGIYTGTVLSQLDKVASGETALEFEAVSGTNYEIAVDRSGGLAGEIQFQLTLDYPPPNDQFANRTSVAGVESTVLGWNTMATREYGEVWHADQYGGRSVWYRWHSPVTGTITLNLTSTFWPNLLAVYRGSSAESLVPVVTAEGPFTETELGYYGLSQVTFPVEEGTEYTIAIAGAFGSAGDFSLKLQLFRCVIEPLADGYVHLTFLGLGGHATDIQTSVNLIDWTHLTSCPTGHETFELDVMTEPGFPRFFQGILQTP